MDGNHHHHQTPNSRCSQLVTALLPTVLRGGVSVLFNQSQLTHKSDGTTSSMSFIFINLSLIILCGRGGALVTV